MNWLYRWTAFSLFVCAAFAVSVPWLDRAGTAALALGFVALSLSPGGTRASRPARMNLPPKQVDVRQQAEANVNGVLERIGAYSEPE